MASAPSSASSYITNLVTTATTPNSTPTAIPISNARRLPVDREPNKTQNKTIGAITAMATAHAISWPRYKPGRGRAITTNIASATVSTTAQTHSGGETRRPASRALSGNANSSDDTISGWTTSSDPIASATAWHTYPVTATPVPIHHSRFFSKALTIVVLTPLSSGTSIVARCRTTIPIAMQAAASKAKKITSPCCAINASRSLATQPACRRTGLVDELLR